MIKAKRMTDLFVSSNGRILYGVSACSYKVYVIEIKSKKIKNVYATV